MHMLCALPLLAIFLVIGSKLFISNNQLLKEAAEREGLLMRTDNAVYQLRTDAWMSSDMAVDGQTLTLTQGEQKIRWLIDPEGALTRVDPGEERNIIYSEIDAQDFSLVYGTVVVQIAGESFLCPLGHAPSVVQKGDKP
jgi:hypothetical protein